MAAVLAAPWRFSSSDATWIASSPSSSSSSAALPQLQRLSELGQPPAAPASAPVPAKAAWIEGSKKEATHERHEGGEEKEASKLPTYSMEEVGRHRGPDSYWIAVRGHVYDISPFVLSGRHPGGDLIDQGFGRDATVMFVSTHPARANAVLAKYLIGKLQVPGSSFDYKYDSPFYAVLQQRVEAYFQEKKISKRGSPLLWLQALQTIFFFFFFMYVGYIKGSLLGCALMGWFYSQFGITIMHDGTHGAFSQNSTVCKLASLVMDLMGSSSLVWKHEHNIGHHQYTNSIDDPDATTAFPILRYHPLQPWRSYHRFQHYYVWLLYPFIVYKWYLSDIVFVTKRQYRSIPMYDPPTSYLIIFAITKAILPFWVILLPCYLHGIGYGLLCMAITFCVASYCFALQFVVTHLADDVNFPEEMENEKDWAKCQVLSSSNYATNSFLATWFSGGLNHQIEHHLFPVIAHTRLAEIAPIVKSTCAEFGLPYYEHSSFFVALRHHFEHLRRMSERPANSSMPVQIKSTSKCGMPVFSGCAVFFMGVAIITHILS